MLQCMNYSAHIHTKGYFLFQKGLTSYLIMFAVCIKSTYSYCCYNKYTPFEAWTYTERRYIRKVH